MRTMRSLSLVPLALLAVLAAAPRTATAGKGKQVRYVGIHPVPKAEGGGVCYIEGPHVHVFAANKLEYRDHRGQNYFVGDPVAYGYDGPRHTYRGHHPVQVDVVVGDDDHDTEYCYLDGAHYHSFAPPPGPEFEVTGGVNFYVGEPPPAYIEARPALIKVNAVYEPLVYTRPVVEVEPPRGWIGVRAGFAVPTAAVIVDERPAAVVVPGRVRGGVGVGVGVGLDVVVPAPSLSIGIGIGTPGVIVRDRPRGYRYGKHKKFKGRKWKR